MKALRRSLTTWGALLVCFTGSVQPLWATESFTDFWACFRHAVTAGDRVAVANMTQFPLETRGPDDTDPIFRVTRDEFESYVFDKAMTQIHDSVVIGGALVNITLAQAIKEKRTIEPGDLQSSGFSFFLSMQFRQIDGGWKLTRIYLEEQ